ncbi:MAG TPA: helix-turn-helix transcriptional regulator [Ktedonobacteraceae bacterium]|jgi:DNA-binding Xre family transcriptional regulator|nr:helix-turn-helix transcriptional regulator [Ktedonobacteraceae bacterium]
MYRLRVKEIAQAQGYNISTLSRRADVPLITVRRIWNNPRYRVRLDTLERIAEVLNVGVSDLIEDVPEKPEQEK